MLPSRLVAGMLPVGLMVLGTGVVSGQTYPNKPIRIVTTAVAGGNDITARIVAQGITGLLNQPVIVDNRAASLSAEIVSKAPPDGYTVLVGGGSFWIFPLLAQVPYDPAKDFSPVTLATGAPNILLMLEQSPSAVRRESLRPR